MHKCAKKCNYFKCKVPKYQVRLCTVGESLEVDSQSFFEKNNTCKGNDGNEGHCVLNSSEVKVIPLQKKKIYVNGRWKMQVHKLMLKYYKMLCQN